MNFRLLGKDDWLRIVNYVRTLEWQRQKYVDGKPVYDDQEKPVMEDVCYRVTIEEAKPNRSLEQNSRYWALLTAISQQAPAHMGGEWHSPEVWHHYCASRFLGMEAGPFGHGVAKSTRKLKVAEFGDYMTEVEAWAVDQFPGFDFGYEAAA